MCKLDYGVNMNEAIRNLIMLMWTASVMNSNAYAQSVSTYSIEEEAPAISNVVVFGSANLGNNKRNEVLLEQDSEENPLGNPIEVNNDVVDSNNTSEVSDKPIGVETKNAITEDLPQNPMISPQESPQDINNQIQDALYESGGRIYDIQSYPEKDINTIEKPNINSTITTYPAD